jgi:hypothetical protein
MSLNLPIACIFAFFCRGTAKEVTKIGKALNFHEDAHEIFFIEEFYMV